MSTKRHLPDTAEQTPEGEREQTRREVLVYIGPSIHGVIASGAVMYGTREEVLEGLGNALGRNLLERLVVSGRTLAQDRISVKTPGTPLYAAYGRLTAQLKESGRNGNG